MIAKLLLIWGVAALSLTMLAQSQYDPLADEYVIPSDSRRVTSLDDGKVYLDPATDPLSIAPLTRPLDTEHTWEYLEKVRSWNYNSPGAAAAGQGLAGTWRFELTDSTLRHLNLQLLQNQDVVYGRGTATVGGVTQSATASGTVYNGVLYLDVVSPENLMLYKCSFALTEDYLSGNYFAFDEMGRSWNGTATGRRN
ncbi:MAG: hypothetical protein HPY61_06815 [Methanotrichaceae archaeon]|nr:hypothetical protein [Methanotrichaceae archaeon]